MRKYENENWDKFLGFDGKKMGKYKKIKMAKNFEALIYACPEWLHIILL